MSEIAEILEERSKTHGDFTTHAAISQDLKQRCVQHGGWQKLTAVQREAIDMICHKIGRVLNGNPNHKDHWSDIAGYAELAAQRCQNPS